MGDGYHNNVIIAIQSLGNEVQKGHSVDKYFPSQVFIYTYMLIISIYECL